MCLATPGIIEEINGEFARIRIGDILVEASVALVPEAKVGDYALVHTGYVIQLLQEEEAEETLDLLQQIMASPEN